MRIVFFGTPEFAAYSLKRLFDAGKNVVAVVTAPDKPAGRGLQMQSSAVKKMALELGLPVLQPEKLKADSFIQELKALDADLGIVIAFRMMPEMVWSMPRLGTFNLHASLLPNYRGAAPINHAIIQGEKQTGVTTFFLRHEIDTGDILLQQVVAIEDDDNAGTLHDKLMVSGADLVLQTLGNIENGTGTTIPQVLTGKEKSAPKIFKDFCKLSAEDSVLDNHNKVRGLFPFPAAWLESEYGTVKILETALPAIPLHVHETNLAIYIKGLFMRCKDGWLEVKKLQPAGKPAMTAKDFINGFANKK